MEFILTAESRSDLGKGASRRLRREGKVPAVVYGGENPAQSILLTQSDLAKVMKSPAFYSTILNLSIDNNSEEVVVKDIQRHPFKELITHMDFQRVVRGQTMKFTVPLKFINEDVCKGVKLQGGEIYHTVTEVEIECRPSKLPEFIEVDMTEVELDQVLHLNDIQLDEGIELVAFQGGFSNDVNEAIANVSKVFDKAVEEGAPDAPEAPEATGQSGEDEA